MTLPLAGFGALVIAAFLQLALPGGELVWGMEPNLVLALVVGWTWVRGPRWAFVWAVLGGLLLDLSGGGVIGVHAVCLLVAAYAVGLVRSAVPAHGWVLTVPAGVVGGALYAALLVVALHVFAAVPWSWNLALAQAGGGVLSAAVLSVPFALVFTALRRTLGAQREA